MLSVKTGESCNLGEACLVVDALGGEVYLQQVYNTPSYTPVGVMRLAACIYVQYPLTQIAGAHTPLMPMSMMLYFVYVANLYFNPNPVINTQHTLPRHE